MNISRRVFLKGLAILPAAAYAPALLASKEVKIKPLPKKAEEIFWIEHDAYLDRIVSLYGICRAPGETDDALRKRALDAIRGIPHRFNALGGKY